LKVPKGTQISVIGKEKPDPVPPIFAAEQEIVSAVTNPVPAFRISTTVTAHPATVIFAVAQLHDPQVRGTSA